MVFSSQLSEDQLGQAIVVQCQRKVSSASDLTTEAEWLWSAEDNKVPSLCILSPKRSISAKWGGCVALLGNPQTEIPQELFDGWADRVSTEKHYNANERRLVDRRGTLLIPCPIFQKVVLRQWICYWRPRTIPNQHIQPWRKLPKLGIVNLPMSAEANTSVTTETTESIRLKIKKLANSCIDGSPEITMASLKQILLKAVGVGTTLGTRSRILSYGRRRRKLNVLQSMWKESSR